MTLPPDIDRRRLDADGHVIGNLRCDNCGYNLRTLAATGNCPECAAPVLDSLRIDELRYAPASYVRSLAIGAGVLAGAVAALLASVVLMLPAVLLDILEYRGTASRALAPLVALLVAVSPPLLLIGLLLITRRDPRARARNEPVTARRALRFAVVLVGAALLVTLGLDAVSARLGPLSFWLALLLALGTLVLVGAIIPGMLLFHLRNLMRRVPNEHLAKRAEGVFALHAIACLVGFIVVVAGIPLGSTQISELFLLGGFLCGLVLYLIAQLALLLPVAEALRAAARKARAHEAASRARSPVQDEEN